MAHQVRALAQCILLFVTCAFAARKKYQSPSKTDITEMRHDDPDDALVEIDAQMASMPPFNRRRRSWPHTANNKLCAMDSVPSMIKLKYPMYTVFEENAKFDVEECKASGCVPLMDMQKNEKISAESCQKVAERRSHPYFAIGEVNGAKRCYTFADCGQDGRTDQAGVDLFERPSPTQATSATPSPITCDGEQIIKKELETQLKKSPLPADEKKGDDPRQSDPKATILRAVFHDAQDFNSLMARNSKTNEWEAVSSENGYAGVDGCFYDNTPAEKMSGGELDKLMYSDMDGSASYNFNLRRYAQNQDAVRINKFAYSFVQKACYNLCCKASSKLGDGEKATLCGTASCEEEYYTDTCYVDVMTFASLLIIEEAGGPHVPMTWGRKQGDCRNPFKDVSLPDHIDPRRIAQGGAPLNAFGAAGAAAIFHDFQGINFNKTEAVALIGAHTFGKIHKYTGGPRTRNRGGGFCTDPTLAKGFIAEKKSVHGSPVASFGNAVDHLDAFSTPKGKCKHNSVDGDGALDCWTNERGYLEPSRTGSAEQDSDYQRWKKSTDRKLNSWSEANKKHRAQMMVNPTWGRGGFWDTTPNKFDNEYFIGLSQTDTLERNNCCGPTTEFGCGTDSTESTNRDSDMQSKDGSSINGCDVDWCLRSAGGTTGLLGGGNPTENSVLPDYVMMSTKTYVQSNTPTVDGKVGVHRLYRLAADWALIEDQEAKQIVSEFAESEAKFHAVFASAWSRIIELGYSAGELKTCKVR